MPNPSLSHDSSRVKRAFGPFPVYFRCPLLKFLCCIPRRRRRVNAFFVVLGSFSPALRTSVT